MKYKIRNDEVASLSNASMYPFPKYTTMLINQMNQIAQGTRPKVVGQMSELIQEFDGQTLEEWIVWYNERQPNAYKEKFCVNVYNVISKTNGEIINIEVLDTIANLIN